MAAEKLRAFVSQELTGPSRAELSASLDEARAEASAARVKAEEGASLLRQAEYEKGGLLMKLSTLSAQHENVKSEYEALQRESDILAVGKMELEEEVARLQAALKESQQATEASNKALEASNNILEAARAQAKSKLAEQQVAFQQQVDEAFDYGYSCCMKRNSITDDEPCVPSDDEEEAAPEDPEDLEGAGPGSAQQD